MYTYPSRPTGTAQDLMSAVTRSGELAIEREGRRPPPKTPLARALIEPPCNLAGMLLRALLERMPADAALSFQDALLRRLAGGWAQPFEPGSPILARAVAEARALEKGTGRAPALVALLSHPPVLGEGMPLNFELVRHASLALRFVRGRPCRPRVVAAVDPFALDSACLSAEGFYAGFMGRYHLGLDRLAFGRGRLSAFLLGEIAWPSLARRLLGRLRAGGEVAMALSGGVPATARVLYTTREWIARQRRQSPLRGAPAEVLRRLRARPDFLAFEAGGPHGPALRRSAWRMLEGWAMFAVAGLPWKGEPAPTSCAESGELGPQARGALAACLEALDIPETRRAAAWEELDQEWRRQTPFRRRLFGILAGRVCRYGRPVLFLPVVHRRADGQPMRTEAAPGVEAREAWSWTACEGGAIRARVLGETIREWRGTAEEFAVEFGQRNFP